MRDLGFGSTLNEQERFTDSLLSWIDFSFPQKLPLNIQITHDNNSNNSSDNNNSDVSNFDYGNNRNNSISPSTSSCAASAISITTSSSFWAPLLEIAVGISTWIPKLCLTLQINDIQNNNNSSGNNKKNKIITSVLIACKQIAIIERILLYANKINYSNCLSVTINCLWTKNDDIIDTLNAIVVSNIDGGGLLSCLDQLASTGAYIDTFLSLKLQYQIVRSLCRLLQYGSKDLLYSLLDCGVMNSFVLFLQCAVDVIRSIIKNNQIPQFSTEYKTLFSVVYMLWETLLLLNDSRVVDNIIDSCILQKIVEEWLPCMNVIVLNISTNSVTGSSSGGSSDNSASYNPLVIRSLAISIIQNIFAHIKNNNNNNNSSNSNNTYNTNIYPKNYNDNITTNPNNKLGEEICRWMTITNTIYNELNILQYKSNTNTSPRKLRNISNIINNNNNTGSNSGNSSMMYFKRTAASVLMTIANANDFNITEELRVRGPYFLSRFFSFIFYLFFFNLWYIYF